MRFVTLASCCVSSIALLASSAFAQGTPANSKAAERWDGYYTGANLGGAFGGADMLSIIPSGAPFKEGEFYAGQPFDPAIRAAFSNLDVDFDASFTGGFQAGVLSSTAGVVFGVEADINLLDVNDAASVTVKSANPGGGTYTFRNEIDMDYVASLKARIGFPIDDWLIYGTAGLAMTTINYSHEFDGTAVVATAPVAPNPAVAPFAISERESISKTTVGWTLGGGIEYLISPSWSLRTEYSYTNFGKVSTSDNKISPASGNGGAADAPCGVDTRRGAEFFDGLNAQNAPTPRQCFTHEADVVLHSVRLGLNYKFDQESNGTAPPRSSDFGPANWTGLYLGGHGGYAEQGATWGPFATQTGVVQSQSAKFDAEGWLFGGQAGYNYQIGSFVFGAEATLSGTSELDGRDQKVRIRGITSDVDVFTTDVDDLWTATGRIGFAWQRLMFFGKGGYANGRVEVTGANDDGQTFQDNDRLSGWVLGGGVEYLLTKNIVVGLEYVHVDLGEHTFRFNSGAIPLQIGDVEADIDTVNARLSYKFAGP